LDKIKERPNDSDNNGSDPSSGQNENSGSKSEESKDDHLLCQEDDYEEEEGLPIVHEIVDDLSFKNQASPTIMLNNRPDLMT